jgi:shikimate kinase
VVHGRHPQRNIVLTGFHGAGKSSVGLELSRRMRRPFIDVASELRRRRSRMRVLLPSSAMDEEEAERALIADLSYRQETIIEVGVDVAARGDCFAELRDFSFIVFIDPPVEALLARMRSDRKFHQLLQADGIEEAYSQLAAVRPRLERCDFQLTGEYTPQRSAALIIHSFYT